MDYRVATPYPGTNVQSYISAKLLANGWSRLSLDAFNSADVPIPSKWKAWTNVQGGEVRTREEQWSTKNGDVVAYKFWYYAPEMSTLRVQARFCSASQLEHIYHHVHCPQPDAASLKGVYEVSVYIMKIEPDEDGFRVHYRLENTGDEQVYIASLGKWPDGSHHLQSIAVEQSENDTWGSVGGECVEHAPVSWEILKPRDVIDGWMVAVSFPEPNHRFGMCIRRIAGLNGPVRVSVSYFRNICEIQHILEVKHRLSASSTAVELPVSQRPR